jgi:energy-coupling factor transporter ATP-binding protein EcfA2
VPSSSGSRPTRVYIVGAGGSGKTTLARQLSRVMHTPPIELDLDPTTDRDALAARDEWVVEGIFLYGIEPLLERAGLIVWLDLPARIAQAAHRRPAFLLELPTAKPPSRASFARHLRQRHACLLRQAGPRANLGH